MHASLENLLKLRDGEADETTRQHVAACPDCRAELDRLFTVRDRLQALPFAAPPADRWSEVQRRLRERRVKRGRAPLFVGLAAAASVLLAVALVTRVESPVTTTAIPDPLVQRSQQLERELRAMEQRGVLSGAEAQLIAELEDRIAVVDLQLASGEVGPEEADRLWQRRVDLLMDLKAVKADEVYLSDSGIYVL